MEELEQMKVIVQNLVIEYNDEGAGSVVLFLHGWRDSLHSFDSLALILSSAHRVVRLDLPGFGKSEAPKEVWNLDNYIEFVKDFVKKLDLSVYVLVGHSFGGRITIKGQATNNFSARKIILIGSAGIAKRRTFRNFIIKILAKVGNLITYIPPLIFWRNGLRKKLYSVIGSDYFNAGGLKETFKKIVAEDLSLNAKNITIPALLIWGEKDTETPLADGKRMSQLINGSKLEVMGNAGHHVHQEKPKEVAKLIQEFI